MQATKAKAAKNPTRTKMSTATAARPASGKPVEKAGTTKAATTKAATTKAATTKAATTKAATTKAATTKAPTKKAPTKRAPTKKAPTKAAAIAKATPTKSVTKSVAAAQASSKKVASKKSAASRSSSGKSSSGKSSSSKSATKQPSATGKPAVPASGASPVGAALVAVGAQAPDFTLPDGAGKPVTLSSLRGGPVVLYFYPKDDTSGCTAEACDFRDNLAAFRKLGCTVLGVSPDSVASHAKFAAKHALGRLTLLADEPDASGTPAVCAAYGVWQEKSMYGRAYMGVVRTTYLIAADGTVAARFDKVSVTDHAAEVLKALRGI